MMGIADDRDGALSRDGNAKDNIVSTGSMHLVVVGLVPISLRYYVTNTYFII